MLARGTTVGDAVCLECECPIEASVEQRIGEGKRSCRCTTTDLREALGRAYTSISDHGVKLDKANACIKELEAALMRLRDLRSWHGGNVPACEPDHSAYMDARRIARKGDDRG